LLLADALIETAPADGLGRASELLADARERAARWSGWSDGPYGRALLVPAPHIFARLEEKLAAASDRDARRAVPSGLSRGPLRSPG
jgi:hypothetical protein